MSDESKVTWKWVARALAGLLLAICLGWAQQNNAQVKEISDKILTIDKECVRREELKEVVSEALDEWGNSFELKLIKSGQLPISGSQKQE